MSDFKQLYLQGGYCDCTEVIETIIQESYCCITSNESAGLSTFLSTLQYFFDRRQDMRQIFNSLNISNSSNYKKYLNACNVLMLDFSDFHATDYDNAIQYLRRKMAELYLMYEEAFERNGLYVQARRTYLSIINLTADEKILSRSLYELVDILKYKDDAPFVILLDDLVLLEFHANKYGYERKMQHFLEDFLIQDIYKYCDIFVQIGTKENETSFRDEYCCYYGFSVYAKKIQSNSYKKLYIPLEQQNVCPKENSKAITNQEWLDMHATIFRAHQKKLKKQIRTEKRKKKSDLLCQRKRYSIEANTSLLHYSTNIGLRNFPFSTGSSAYKQKNDFLKKMYIACKAHLSTTDVYAYMLKIKDDIITKFSSEELEQLAQNASKHSEHWKKCTYNQNCNWTYISATHNNNSSYLASNHLKIYVALDILNVEPIFIETIEQLLKKASFSFAAKVSHVSRADQICYWIHPDDYTILDDFFSAYREHLRTDIPFMFYQNGIGISKDFREEISHNTMQAELITEYFKLVSSEDEVQLSSMYQIFIDSWNHSSSHSAYFIRRFSRTPVLCFLVLMDTLGMLLEEQSPCQISLYFCTDMHFWKSLEESHCWADLNQKMK